MRETTNDLDIQLYSINTKSYKAIFWQTQVANVVFILVSYLLVSSGVYILSQFDPGRKLTLPILFVVVILGIVHSQYQRKRLARIGTIEDFDERVAQHEQFYKFRMLWFLFSCGVSCFLTVLTGRYLFLFYGMFDILVSIPLYPNLSRFKQELQNEEIIFY